MSHGTHLNESCQMDRSMRGGDSKKEMEKKRHNHTNIHTHKQTNTHTHTHTHRVIRRPEPHHYPSFCKINSNVISFHEYYLIVKRDAGIWVKRNSGTVIPKQQPTTDGDLSPSIILLCAMWYYFFFLVVLTPIPLVYVRVCAHACV